ncbi:LysE family transporter [Paraburkholderia bengalensis]|uniref:LysE family transporter n=1 Tax=Paraburkholderia bengalensis TaxID=2747562 RepID=A0ABU8INR0_9BURK
MHPYLPILLQIALVYLVALVSPGPNFFMITQLSLAGRRGLGAASALGVGTGSTVWVSLAMLGFATVLQKIDWLYNGIRIAGAIYLVWFGIKLVLASAKRGETVAVSIEPPPTDDRGAYFRAWRAGMLTCLTNPKACAFWTSIFATLFPAHPPLWFYGVALAMIGTMSISWYGGVAVMFATERTQRGYRRLRRPIDGVCGALLVGLGAKLAADS